MAETSIEWATHTFNAFTGCDRVSPGCARCYALDAAASLKRREQGRIDKARAEGKPDPKVRYQNDGDPKTSGPGFGFTVHWDKLKNPSIPPAGSRVFVNSMSDVFHEEAPFDAIAQMFAVFALNPQVNWLILTKRPERMCRLLNLERFLVEVSNRAARETLFSLEWPLPNVWLGVSIENRRFVHRADLLRATPAAIHFISAEPLLGPLIPETKIDTDIGELEYDGEKAWVEQRHITDRYWDDGHQGSGLNLTDIDWIICGGESGPKHRRLDLRWIRDLRDACKHTDTAFFLKQIGGRYPGGELGEFPPDLRIREFPAAASIAGAS